MRMELAQCAVSIIAAFAFDRWQASDPLPTGQSWLLCVLLVGVGAAWLFTVIVCRLPARYSRWLLQAPAGPPDRYRGP
jgi:hypothetical protein